MAYHPLLLFFFFLLSFNKRCSSIISISTFVGSSVILKTDHIDRDDNQVWQWWKGQSLLSVTEEETRRNQLTPSSYQWINRTNLLIEQTTIGDEGFYTLTIVSSSHKNRSYSYHVLLFENDLSLTLSPADSIYHEAQTINLTCSIRFYADRSYIDRMDRLSFSSIWSMIIYNNNPDDYQLIRLSTSSSYRFTGAVLHYQVDREDHRQNVTCSLFEHQSRPISLRETTSVYPLNITYKAYLRGEYYFTRSFPSHSSIEIHCDEFDGNPTPLYTLLWSLNEINRTLLNKSLNGRYVISDATWRHRGLYTCLAENQFNDQPASQSFRLNIWFDEHRIPLQSTFIVQSQSLLLRSSSSRWFVLSFVSVLLLVSSLLFICSISCFCIRYHQQLPRK